jgi:hypothetical protein
VLPPITANLTTGSKVELNIRGHYSTLVDRIEPIQSYNTPQQRQY